MKQEFLNFLQALMEASPETSEKLMTDDIRAYIDMLAEKKEKPALTDCGKKVLTHLQSVDNLRMFKSADVALALGMNSKAVSSALRKLVEDGFCEKVGQNPIIYNLTNKGKSYKII